MDMPNRSHNNHALMSLNQMRRDKEMKYKSSSDFVVPDKSIICLSIMDCIDFLKLIPDESVQLICIDPPYNLEMAQWDIYDDYIDWASGWINEAYRVLSKNGNMAIFGGIQFRDVKSGDLIDIIHYIREKTNFKLINTIIWRYKNGMSAQRYFANRHEEIIWLAKSNDYYFDLDSVREPYPEPDLLSALRDKRLNPENTMKGKNPTNVWEINRLNGNSKERVGHPTQKPLEIIDRLVKSLSYPGSVVLDFFAGSGTTGRVCIDDGRHCLMCDNDLSTIEYFRRHIDNMRRIQWSVNYESTNSVEDFFDKLKGSENCEEQGNATVRQINSPAESC